MLCYLRNKFVIDNFSSIIVVIEEDLLITYGADIIRLKKDEMLFRKNSIPLYFYQVKKGRVKLINSHGFKKEFVHNFYLPGESIGGIFLFSTINYPIDAVAMEECIILKLDQSKFLKLLKDHDEVQIVFFQHLAEQAHFKYIVLNSIMFIDPVSGLKNLIQYLKNKHFNKDPYCFQIPYTRKEISSLTGLRVETVIRTFKKMEKERIIKIIKGKIFY